MVSSIHSVSVRYVVTGCGASCGVGKLVLWTDTNTCLRRLGGVVVVGESDNL